jgi:hypothetical protein
MRVLNETVYMYISSIRVSLFYIREDVIDGFDFATRQQLFINSYSQYILQSYQKKVCESEEEAIG